MPLIRAAALLERDRCRATTGDGGYVSAGGNQASDTVVVVHQGVACGQSLSQLPAKGVDGNAPNPAEVGLMRTDFVAREH